MSTVESVLHGSTRQQGLFRDGLAPGMALPPGARALVPGMVQGSVAGGREREGGRAVGA